MIFVYIDKEEVANTGRPRVLVVFEKENEEYAKAYNAIFYKMTDNNLPEFLKLKDDKEAVEMNTTEAIQKGFIKLSQNEKVVDGQVATVSEFQKVEEDKIIEKPAGELLEEGLIDTTECQKRYNQIIDLELNKLKKFFEFNFKVGSNDYSQKINQSEKLKNIITELQIEYSRQKDEYYLEGKEVDAKTKILIKSQIKKIWEFSNRKVAFLDFKTFDKLMSLSLEIISFFEMTKFAMETIISKMNEEQLKEFDPVRFWKEHYYNKIPKQGE